MSGIWNGTKTLTGESELKRECRYCGYCGARMNEILHPAPIFDRQSGRQGASGSVYWECPKHGIGLDAMYGEWVDAGYEHNPHDSAYLWEK